MVRVFIETLFPTLRNKPWRITSPPSTVYNCIAWAVTDTSIWWWPTPIGNVGVYWPPSVPRDLTVAAFIQALATVGFSPCHDESPEIGYERIALFAYPDGEPSHAARQLPTGRWTSKLGELEDIEHDLLDLEGDAYGAVSAILKRPVPGP